MIISPNKAESGEGIFYQGGSIPFLQILSELCSVKTQLHSDSNKGFLFCLGFVWRQSEFAFFSASASVGALFYSQTQ